MSKPPSPPKRHHFIPQMMLRHFAAADGQLWFWRRDFAEGEVRKASTQNLFVEKDLYTLIEKDGAKDVALETFFSKLEGIGARFIEDLATIVREGSTPTLDAAAWNFWGHFFYYHLKRTPGTIAAFAEAMNFDDRVAKTAKEIRAIRAKTGGAADEDGLETKIRKNAVVIAQAAGPSPEVLAIFETLGLAIYKITDPKKSFIVGDAPGALARFPTAQAGLSHPTLFLPLTWDIAVGQLTGGQRTEVISVDREQIRRMNEASAARSLVIAGRSAELVGSLANAVPYRGVEMIRDETEGYLPPIFA